MVGETFEIQFSQMAKNAFQLSTMTVTSLKMMRISSVTLAESRKVI